MGGETDAAEDGGVGQPAAQCEKPPLQFGNQQLSTCVLFAAVHPRDLPNVTSCGLIEPLHTPCDHPSLKSKDAGPGEVGFLCESPEDAFFLMHKNAARTLRVSLSDGGAQAVGTNDATGQRTSYTSEHGLVGTRTVILKLTVPMRAWYEWQRENAHYFKTPLPHFQFQRPFSIVGGSVVQCFSVDVSCDLASDERTPVRESVLGGVSLWIPLRPGDCESVLGHFGVINEDGWKRGDPYALSKALLSTRDMSDLILVPGLCDLKAASLAFRDPALALLTMDSFERRSIMAGPTSGCSPAKRRRTSLFPLSAMQDPAGAGTMPANKPTEQRTLLEVRVTGETFGDLVLNGHASVISWNPCPHVRLGRHLFSAPAAVAVHGGCVQLSLRPYEQGTSPEQGSSDYEV